MSVMNQEQNADNAVLKFCSLEMENFGCVEHGVFSMEEGGFSALKITGVYGQNGSGKSTLVNAFALLRLLLCGSGIDSVQDYIRSGQTFTSLKAEFTVDAGSGTKRFSYYVKIQKTEEVSGWAVGEEKITVSDANNLKNKHSLCYNAQDNANPVTPVSAKNQLASVIGKIKMPGISEPIVTQVFLLTQKEISRIHKTSYLFAPDFKNIYIEYCRHNNGSIFYYILIMIAYAQNYFFVIKDSFVNGELIGKNTIPVMFPNQSAFNAGAQVYFPISTTEPTRVVEKEPGVFSKFIDNLNQLIAAVCPGTKLTAKEVPYYDGRPEPDTHIKPSYYEILTEKDGLKIPIRYESLGIKKLISLINVMAFAYGNKSVFLVIDEIDSCINELVLETFLKLFAGSANGQLAFTSNNLYPLELLEKNECCFTTTQASDRYTRLKYVKPNNNLRSLYLSLARQGGDEKNTHLFNPVTVENMQRIFDSVFEPQETVQNMNT